MNGRRADELDVDAHRVHRGKAPVEVLEQRAEVGHLARVDLAGAGAERLLLDRASGLRRRLARREAERRRAPRERGRR